MLKRIFISALFLSSLILQTTATAKSEAKTWPILNKYHNAYQSFLVGGEFGYAQAHYSRQDLNLTSATIDNQTTAFRAYVGYQFTKYFAFETAYGLLGDVVVKKINGLSTKGFVAQKSIDFSAKFIAPLEHSMFAYARAGVSRFSFEPNKDLTSINDQSDKHRFQALLGAGFGFMPNSSFGFELMWNRYFGESPVADTDFIGIGAFYRLRLLSLGEERIP